MCRTKRLDCPGFLSCFWTSVNPLLRLTPPWFYFYFQFSRYCSHNLIEQFIVAVGECPENFWALKHTPPYSIWHPFGPLLLSFSMYPFRSPHLNSTRLFFCFFRYCKHQLVERFVITIGQCPKNVRPLKKTSPYSIRHTLCQHGQFFFVGFKDCCQSVDQGIAGIVAEVQPLVLNPAQVGEPNIDLPRQNPKAPTLRLA